MSNQDTILLLPKDSHVATGTYLCIFFLCPFTPHHTVAMVSQHNPSGTIYPSLVVQSGVRRQCNAKNAQRYERDLKAAAVVTMGTLFSFYALCVEIQMQ